MIVKIFGELTPFYAQTLCLTLFPGATFSETEEPSYDNPTVTFDVSEDDENYYSKVTIEYQNSVYHGENILSKSEKLSRPSLALKISAGKAFINASHNYTGATPPWGILTGVRPSKLAMEMIESGMTEEECAAVFKKEYSVTERKAYLAARVASAEKRLITPELYDECSLYVAIPFCPSRCSYCSFVSFTSKKLLSLVPSYLEVLLKEIKRVADIVKLTGKNVTTVYIGGGTPTVLTEAQLESLLSAIAESFDLSKVREFTLEAGRPDTITAEKMECAKKYGVTRVSVNTQTLNEEVLASIGRAHTADDFFGAYDIARKSGIRDINVDLIAGLPGESFESFASSVDRVVALRPENITVHTFCVKKSADVKKSVQNVFSGDHLTAVKSVDYSQKIMNEAGYFPYYMYRQKNTRGNLENVGFSLKGKEGLYNIYMMEEIQSIFAIGASAVTKLVTVDKAAKAVNIKRIAENKYPFEYIAEKNGESSAENGESLKQEILEFFGL